MPSKDIPARVQAARVVSLPPHLELPQITLDIDVVDPENYDPYLEFGDCPPEVANDLSSQWVKDIAFYDGRLYLSYKVTGSHAIVLSIDVLTGESHYRWIKGMARCYFLSEPGKLLVIDDTGTMLRWNLDGDQRDDIQAPLTIRIASNVVVTSDGKDILVQGKVNLGPEEASGI